MKQKTENHTDAGQRCLVAHVDGNGQPLPPCIKCAECGEWLRPDEFENGECGMSYPIEPNGVNKTIYVDPFDWWTADEAEAVNNLEFSKDEDYYTKLDDLEAIACNRALESFQAQVGNVVGRVLCKPDYM